MAKNKNKLKKNHEEQILISYDVITSASYGDVDALNAILKHYEKYISGLAMVKIINNFGKSEWVVDYEVRDEIEKRLIISILAFEVA